MLHVFKTFGYLHKKALANKEVSVDFSEFFFKAQ